MGLGDYYRIIIFQYEWVCFIFYIGVFMLEFRVVGYLRRMASRLLEARVSEYIEMAERTIGGYLKTGLRKEIVDGVNWKSLLHGLVSTSSPEEAYDILDGVAYKFVTGKALDPVYDTDEAELEDLKGVEFSWKQGYGHEISQRLYTEAKELLKRHKLVTDVEELKDLGWKVVLRGDEVDGKILDKVKKDLSSILAVQVRNDLVSEKRHIIERRNKKAPLTTLEPGEKKDKYERGESVEKAHPQWLEKLEGLGIDLDEIQKYVESFPPPKGKIYSVILKNILGDPPYGSMSQEGMGKELGVSFQRVSEYQKELVGIIKDRFFKGVPKKEKVEVGKGELRDLDKGQLDDFLEFLGDELRGKIFDRVKGEVEGIVKGKPLAEIATDVGTYVGQVQSDVKLHIKPQFEAWKKEQVKMASVSDIIHKVYAARRNKRQREFEQTFKGMPPGPTPEERFKEKGVKELEEKYEGLPEETVRGPSVPEDDMAAILEQAAGDKEKMKDKIKGQFEKRIIKPRYFIATVEFSSKYDWADIGHGKFHPEKDAEGKWTSDDPEFKWVGYKVSVDKTLHVGKRSTKIVYNMDAKLKASGELEGGVTSRLRIVDQSADGDKVVIDDHGKSGYSSVVDEMFLDLVREHGVIMTGRVGIPQEYHNVHLKRDYNNVGDFEAEYGGIGFSDPKHREKAEEYREFVKKREEHQMGHQKDLLDDAPTLISRLTFFVKKPHIQPLDKNMAKEYIKELKGKPSKEKMVEVSKFLESHDRAEMERMKQVEIF